MKTFFILSMAIISLGTLSACVYHPHPTHPHANGDFCPPGQAKKGNC